MDMRKAAPKKKSVVKPGRVTIDDLAIMMKNGFERVGREMQEMYIGLDGQIGELRRGLFAVETKLESVDARLTSLEKTVEPLTISYHVFSHQLRTLDTRVNVLEQKNGIQPE